MLDNSSQGYPLLLICSVNISNSWVWVYDILNMKKNAFELTEISELQCHVKEGFDHDCDANRDFRRWANASGYFWMRMVQVSSFFLMKAQSYWLKVGEALDLQYQIEPGFGLHILSQKREPNAVLSMIGQGSFRWSDEAKAVLGDLTKL